MQKRKLFMRTNTYIRLEMLYKKYKGYVETREILEEGFSNRQIAVLVKKDIWRM